MYIIPNEKSIEPPTKVEILPYFWFNLLPIFKPKKVKDKLVIANVNAENIYLLVIIDNPIPVVKLSILTDKPNKKYPGMVNKNFFSVSLKLDIITSKAINTNITPTRILVFIIILFVIVVPINTPINGIIKWYIPTIKDKRTLSLLFIPCVP